MVFNVRTGNPGKFAMNDERKVRGEEQSSEIETFTADRCGIQKLNTANGGYYCYRRSSFQPMYLWRAAEICRGLRC